MTQGHKGRPHLQVDGVEIDTELKILNCKVPADMKSAFVAKAEKEGFRSASAKLRKLVVDDLKRVSNP